MCERNHYFFAVFPTSSPIDRRLPWLKQVLLGLAVAVSVLLARIIHEEADYSRKTNAPVWYKGCAHRPFATTEALA